MILRASFTILLSFFLVLVSRAQGDLRFRNLTINNGLSQSSVSCIVQDDQNAIWIGTQDGLNRYDGHSFQIYTSRDTDGLTNDYIQCGAKDSKGNIWFGTNSGLTKFDPRTEEFKTYAQHAQSAFSVSNLAIGSDGRVWLTTVDDGAFVFDSKTKKFTSLHDQIPSKKTIQVYGTLSGTIIFATEDKGIFVYNSASGKVTKGTLVGVGGNIPFVNCIRPWKEDAVLLATNHGVYTFNFKTLSSEKKLRNMTKDGDNVNVSDVLYNKESGWIVATNGSGLYLVNNKNEVRQYTEDIFQKNALLINELNVLFRDQSGIIWVGTQRGLSSFDPEYKGILGMGPSGNDELGISSPNVWSFAESASGEYTYIGTDRAVARWDRKTGKFTQYYREKAHSTVGTGETAVLSMYVISDNRMLVACADGVFLLQMNGASYNYIQIQERGSEASLDHKRAYFIEKWKDSKYFIATRDGVLLYDANTGKIQIFEHDPKNKGNTISEGVCRLVFKDTKGKIWFATSTGGLNVLSEKEGKITIQPYKYNAKIKGTSKDYITAMHQDASGNYWLSTLGSGLLKWNESSQKISVFNRSNGLPNDVIYGIVSDKKGDLWLSTNKGLCSFSPTTKKVKIYTERQGLMSNEFNLGAYMKGKDGFLYFGGIYGFNYFNPEELVVGNTDIRISFSKFKLENEWLTPNKKGSPLERPIYETRDLYLSYRQSSFTLRFQPSDFSNPEAINYKYVLAGSDEGEILIGSMNEIHFNALSPGDYELLIYARHGNGEWSKVPARMNIFISPPYWRTWWFWTIIGVILALLIRWFIRRRIDSARREQIRLEIKVRNRTKEIQQQNQKIAAQKLKIEEERNKVIKQQKLLQIEKDKTEKLLKNVIPESTAEELKKRGRARARAYKVVSVLFTDFVGFTKISDRMPATELVKKLDVYFTKFDEIIVKNNLEKIKTIGDAYMCAGGVPVRNNTNPIDTSLAALQIQHYMLQRKNDAIANNEEYWELRLGINTGEVTAGVIGSERLAYDIWGATVNQAQRMEMLGAAGRVTITGATYHYIEPYFECIFKGKAQSKSRGLIDMYEVVQIKPELSVNGEGIYPNSRFQEIVNLHLYSSINYYKAERHIMKLLEQHLSKQLHYHSVTHSKDVVAAVERLALLENVTDEGLFLLKSAANYHDAGFMEQYDANEPIGARLAGEILPTYGYTEEHIAKIKELIYATKIPHAPKNKLEEIICDADLDYLGRDDFHEIADKLRLELREHGKINSDRLWDEIQVSFLKSHRYFTKTAIESRRPKKLIHLKEVEERLERNEYVD